MATGGSSPGTIYSPLPQSVSDADTTEDEEEEEELNSVALGREGSSNAPKAPHIHPIKGASDGRNGRGRLSRGEYQPLGGSECTLNGITSQLGIKSKDAVRESDVDASHPPPLILPVPERPAMSGPRKACFFFSIALCFLVVFGFLFALPCDLPGCVPPNENSSNSSNVSYSSPISSLRSSGGTWETALPGIELKGRVHLVSSSSGTGLNMVFLVRGQLQGLLSSSTAMSSAMPLTSSSFLYESYNCSFAPLSETRATPAMENYNQATPSYCNTHFEILSNYSSNPKTSEVSTSIERNMFSNSNKGNRGVSSYRRKRFAVKTPHQSQANSINSSLRDIENSVHITKITVNEDYSKNPSTIPMKNQQENVKVGKDKEEARVNPKSKRSSSVKDVELKDWPGFLGAGNGGGLVSLSGATGQPLWQVPLPSPPEELDCGLLDTDGDGILDCLAFAGRSGLLAAVNPSTGAVIWYLHDHNSQMRPAALQFPVSIPDLDGDGTNELAVACTLPNASPVANNRTKSSRVSSSSTPSSSFYSTHMSNTMGPASKSASSSKKEQLIFSSSSSSFSDFPTYKSSRPLPSPSSSPDTVSLALASGRSGSIIGQPFTPSGCVTVSSITLNMQTLNLFYRCIMEGGDETGASLSVEDLYGERFEGTSTLSSSSTSSSMPLVQSLKHSTIPSQDSTSSALNTPPSSPPLSSSHSQRHSTSSSAWVSDHRLLVENHGQCHSILLSPLLPHSSSNAQLPPCSVSVRLTDSRNATLWAHEGVLAHAMDPVPLLFRRPSSQETSESSSISSRSESVTGEHPVSGFVLKFWQWSVPKEEHGALMKNDRDLSNGKTPGGGTNSLFRTRLRRSTRQDLILPPLAAAAASFPPSNSDSEIHNLSVQSKRQSPIANLPHHGGLFTGGPGKKKPKGSSYKGAFAPIVNQLKERVVLITFNDTGLHVINASQSDITQLCERVKGFGGGGKKRGKGAKGKDRQTDGSLPEQKLRCQPELAFQEQSLLVADLDKDGYQELVSYLTTYVDSRRESELKSHANYPKWHLESRVKVVPLEAELPKLYEAVATPGS